MGEVAPSKAVTERADEAPTNGGQPLFDEDKTSVPLSSRREVGGYVGMYKPCSSSSLEICFIKNPPFVIAFLGFVESISLT